ncbi:hypothetical protein CBR_g28550 [Chara braunii]|uniref:Uncharacterized protein n=1 Tax=Chara braunii TaxID=69332 RepID=A0A388JW76_CHABU|nr:hypothetical protein CBR_g28550 [Chara braunii]|eukprot:GBG62074.1 hypothetical protein CBR_g28550 [Chara braunii]
MEPFVLDNGSGFIKAGFANPDSEPHMVIRTAVCSIDAGNGDDEGDGDGVPMSEEFDLRSPVGAGRASGEKKSGGGGGGGGGAAGGALLDTSAAALAAAAGNGHLTADVAAVAGGAVGLSSLGSSVIYPIERGIIKNWEAMEDLWHHIFYSNKQFWEVGQEGQLLIAEPLFTPKAAREKMAQVMFETFNVLGLYSVEQAILSLYAMGRISGCAVDIGHGVIDIAPVWEGAMQHAAAKRVKIGGQDLTELMARLMMNSRSLSSPSGSPSKAKNVNTSAAMEDGGGGGGKHESSGDGGAGASHGGRGNVSPGGGGSGNRGHQSTPTLSPPPPPPPPLLPPPPAPLSVPMITLPLPPPPPPPPTLSPSLAVVINTDIAEVLKERYALVADDAIAYRKVLSGQDATSSLSPSSSSSSLVQHTLPDGQVISVSGRERYTAGEAIFEPSILGINDCGIVDHVYRSITLCGPSENQRQILENIVLCGGGSVIPGLDSRFLREISVLAPPSMRPAVVKPPDYMPENTVKYSAWIGGSILAKNVFPQNQHITKAEYDEIGPTVIQRKCF